MNSTPSQDRAPVAVVIVSWNTLRYLEECLESLRGLVRPPVEQVVVDNGSADGSPEMVRRRFPETRLVLTGENQGYCRANNVGIRLTTAPFVLLLNPDTRLEPDFVERLLPAFEDSRVGMAAGKLLRFEPDILDSCGQSLGRSRQPKDRGYGRRDRGQFDHDGPVFGVCGAAALYRRATLESVADPGRCYFDEAFFAFYEDLDLAWRARRHGWRAAYRHRAVAYHARGGSASASPSKRRVAAMLSRDPDIRFHIVKNRYLTILRNDRLGDYLRDLPFIGARDVATFLLLLFVSPSILFRLWGSRELFRAARRRGKLDSTRVRHQFEHGAGIGAPARADETGSAGSDGMGSDRRD